MATYTTTNLVEDLVDAAGYGITWAEEGDLDTDAQTYTLALDEDAAEELGKDEVVISFQAILDALAKVAQGGIVNQEITQACQVALDNPDLADLDAGAADCVIQVAVFGDVIFG